MNQSDALRWHNAARTEVAQMGLCANMAALRWEPTVAQVATQWASTCPTTHNQNRDEMFRALASPEEEAEVCLVPDARGPCLGENLYWASPCPSSYCSAEAGIWDSWYVGELAAPGECKPFAEGGGHCSQVLWPLTRYVGCAEVFGCYPWQYTLVCNYGPAGNIRGLEPCVLGPACSACPPELPACEAGLCAAK